MIDKDDALDAYLHGDVGNPRSKPPNAPVPRGHSRLPAILVATALALLILTPLVLVMTGDPAEIIVGMIFGDPLSVFGGVF